MARYVDGFVIVVPKNKTDEYKKLAREGAKMWMKHGALDYKECIGEDLNPKGPEPRSQSFLELTKAKPDETVWFSYIVFESRQHRDEVNAKVMKEWQDSGEEMPEMPFDIKRMAYGGFEVAVDI